jgi:hypothetical protein
MKTPHWFTRNRLVSHLRMAGVVTLMSAAAAMAFVAAKPSSVSLSGKSDRKGESKLRARTGLPIALAKHLRELHGDLFETSLGKLSQSGEPEASRIHNGRAQEAYDNRAYPRKWIDAAQQVTAANAASTIAALSPALAMTWTELGPPGVPADALVASESTGAQVGTIYSGRATAIAVSPTCTASSCTVFIGAAGGGVWKTTNALAATPTWTSTSSGIPSNAIGSIAFDPNDTTGNTLYVGTGEPNGSGDSEAGVGLYKSTNGGSSWSLVTGSTASTAPCASGNGTCPVATGRSIGAVAIDPNNASHMFIGTDVARHGSSSVNGGRFTPPGSAKVGLYESTDGGSTFTAKVILTQDTVDPHSATGGDFFRGGCSHIELYRAATGNETQVYASFFDYGVFRRSRTLEHDTAFHQIFKAAGNGTVAQSSFARTEFSLAAISTGPNSGNLRVYVGDASSAPADFYRVDNANVTASTLVGGNNGGWTKLSNPTNGTPGFASFNYCTGQCTYDMPVYSPPGSPDIVYIGGAMQYSEIGGRSNGRAVQRSDDAGVNFTDMTIDTQGVSRHPDQHAMAATPFNPNILFNGDDGGIWRLNGSFSNVSSECASRGLTGANLTDCNSWLSKVPTAIATMNQGLGTLQYQSLSFNANATNDIMGGTQDNGTHGFRSGSWAVKIFGDGGQSGVDRTVQTNRFHTFFDAQIDVNFHYNSSPFLGGFPGDETGWDWISDPFFSGAGGREVRSFYIPIIYDPVVSGTLFTGLQHVWRTQDNGGPQSFLDTNCNEFVGNFAAPCGDWVAIGQDLSSTTFGTDKAPGQYIVATSRPPAPSSNTGTLWVGLRRGRVFVSSNADAAAPNVTFYRIDTSAQPERFVSGIAVDSSNPNHAFVSYSGYNAYAAAAGTAQGHVFEVTYNPVTHSATWSGDLAGNLGDQPVTGIAVDWQTGNVFVSTDFGVFVRTGATTWAPAAAGLPPVAVYGLTVDSIHRLLYAATHGRGAWSLGL